MGQITLSEEELTKIIKECINRIVDEGIDVDTEKMEVGFTQITKNMSIQTTHGIQNLYIIQ